MARLKLDLFSLGFTSPLVCGCLRDLTVGVGSKLGKGSIWHMPKMIVSVAPMSMLKSGHRSQTCVTVFIKIVAFLQFTSRTNF